MKKLEVGCLWNFAKRLRNREVMSFLAKDDALKDLSFAMGRQKVPGEGSEIGPGLASLQMIDLSRHWLNHLS